MEKLLKSEDVFPPGHARAGHPIVEDPKLLAKIEKANEQTLKNFIHKTDQGKATLIANSLNEGKFKTADGKPICIKKSKEVCGVEFAEKYPKDYLRKVGAMEEGGRFFKTAGGLNIAKGVLKSA